MSLSGKLRKWVDAGLISSDQQTRILEHEKGYSGDRWKHGIVFAGLFSILLGFALIVAANWQEITWQTKLAVHFAVNAVLTHLVWTWREDASREKHREVALFFLWGLTLTLIALIGQVFQLGGEAIDAVRVWFWLTTPMILMFARSSFIAKLWALVFVCYVPFDIFSHIEDWTKNQNLRMCMALETAIGLPFITWLLGDWPAAAARRPAIARALRNVGLLTGLIAASASSMLFYMPGMPPSSVLVPIFYSLAVIGMRYLLLALPRNWSDDERGSIDLLAIAGLFVCIPLIALVDSKLMAMLHFLAFWLLAGTIWQQTGHARAVDVAVMIITLRLFIGFIELFGTMMQSGLGFIIGGLVLLALVYSARKIGKALKTGIAS